MKTNIIAPALFLFLLLTYEAAGLSKNEVFTNSEYNRGDTVTVLLKEDSSRYTLELVSSSGKYIGGNIFFPLETETFHGQAALLGLGSSLSPGSYILLLRDNSGVVKDTIDISVVDNEFKSEEIALNSDNTSLRTNSDPEIINEAVEIHSIYNLSEYNRVKGKGELIEPVVNGIITSWYGDRRKFIYSSGATSNSLHTGVDIAAPTGTFIRAAHRGRVVFAGNRIITGKSVVIEYLPGVYGVFFHMEKLFVEKDDLVDPHTVIGTLGATGLATGPHLHWEIRVGGTAVNPFPLIKYGLIDNSLIMSIVSIHTAE